MYNTTTQGSPTEGKLSKRQYAIKRKVALDAERDTWLPEWKDITSYIAPWRGRYQTADANRNKHSAKTKNIYDMCATRAHGVLEAGLMAGNTSPARPWFRLKTPDDALNEYHAVRVWLDDVSKILRLIFAKSNTYKMLRATYAELSLFSVSASIMDRSFNTVVHHNWLTAGEYSVGANDEGRVDTISREFSMTVEQLVAKFGYDNCSKFVRDQYDRFNYNKPVDVLHLIEPRKDRNPYGKTSKDKPFKSCYYELKGTEDNTLRESGYDRFPALVPRWMLATSTDLYGAGPGSIALPHVKQLQQMQLRKAQAIDYQTRPPLQLPSSLTHKPYNLLPGGNTFVSDTSQQGGIRTAFEAQLDIQALLLDIQDVRKQIKDVFFEELFLMLANDDRSGVTAYEIARRHEEKLLMLGPVLENLYGECLEPLVEDTFIFALQDGVLPPPPPEMQGQELSIEFVSTLAQAQRAVGMQSVDRLLGAVGNIAQIRPEAVDKLDIDKIIDEYADAYGVDPSLVIANDKVVVIRQKRAELEAAQQQQAALPGAARAARDLSEAGVDPSQAAPSLTGYSGGGL